MCLELMPTRQQPVGSQSDCFLFTLKFIQIFFYHIIPVWHSDGLWLRVCLRAKATFM